MASTGRDVDLAADTFPKVPHRRRGPVAQHGAGTAGDQRGNPPAAHRDHGMADRVDAVVEPVQVLGRDEPLNRRGGEPESKQLLAPYYPLLPRR